MGQSVSLQNGPHPLALHSALSSSSSATHRPVRPARPLQPLAATATAPCSCSHTAAACSPPGHRSACPRPDQTARFALHGSICSWMAPAVAAVALAASGDGGAAAVGRCCCCRALHGELGPGVEPDGLPEGFAPPIAPAGAWTGCCPGTRRTAWCAGGWCCCCAAADGGVDAPVCSDVESLIKNWRR